MKSSVKKMLSKTWTTALKMSKKTKRLILRENSRKSPKVIKLINLTAIWKSSMSKKSKSKPKRPSSEINLMRVKILKTLSLLSKVRFRWDTMITLLKELLKMHRVSNNSTKELTKMMITMMILMSKLIHLLTMISKQIQLISSTNTEKSIKMHYLRKKEI